MSGVLRTIKRFAPSHAQPILRLGKFAAWYTCRLPRQLSSQRFKVAILFLHAEKARYSGSFDFVERYQAWLGIKYAALIRIDNFNSALAPHKVGENTWEVGGDNSFWEFSGWKKGVRSLRQIGIDAEVLIFINDACLNCNRDELYYRMRFDWRCLGKARHQFAGCFDRAHSQHILLGHDVSIYIRSNFFAMSRQLAERLEWTFLSPTALSEILPEKLSKDIIESTGYMNDNFRSFTKEWITATWHRSERPTAQNWPFLRNKWIACFNERMLTAAIREKGTPLLNAEHVIWG